MSLVLDFKLPTAEQDKHWFLYEYTGSTVKATYFMIQAVHDACILGMQTNTGGSQSPSQSRLANYSAEKSR